MNVKGSIFIQIVKVIKSDKSGIFNKHLTDKDREIISERLLPNIWYPIETYQNCLNAIFEVVAKNNHEIAKEWGRMACQDLMTKMYKGLMVGLDPLGYLKKSWLIIRNFYDFGKTETIVERKNQVVYKLSDFDPQFVVLYYIIEGWIERGMELCGAKKIKGEFLTKSWEGHPFTSIRFTWTL